MLKRDQVDDDYCQGLSFSISDEDALARAVALVLVQEYDLATCILTGKEHEEDGGEILRDKAEIEDIIARRLKPPVAYHRDGFLFQLMMWVAAYLDLEAGDLVALPHAQASAKGQDSIIVHRSEGAIVAMSICEDKATEKPRDTVRDEVWREIAEYEAGGRRDELRSNIIATLGLAGIPRDEATALVRRISWEDKRRYRVRITVEGKRTKGLFKGFEEHVSGSVERRRGETIQIPRLRDWMTRFAEKIEAELRTYSREK